MKNGKYKEFLMSVDQQILDILTCPSCHSKLELSGGGNVLLCGVCHADYEIKDSVPIMLPVTRKKDLQNDLERWRNQEITPQFLSYGTIQLLRSPAPFHWFGKKKEFDKLFSRIKENGLYLDVGGVGTLHSSVLTVNIAPSSDTDIVADGQFLPFPDNSVDGVFILLVLEHVPNPRAISKEIYRILKPGGFVFATLPFLQVMHANPMDFFRFTPDGIRELFTDFEEESLKVAAGPSGTLIWVLKEYIALLCPFSSNSFVYVSVREVVGWVLFPLLVFDLYLNRKPRAEKMASFFSFIGIKKALCENEE